MQLQQTALNLPKKLDWQLVMESQKNQRILSSPMLVGGIRSSSCWGTIIGYRLSGRTDNQSASPHIFQESNYKAKHRSVTRVGIFLRLGLKKKLLDVTAPYIMQHLRLKMFSRRFIIFLYITIHTIEHWDIIKGYVLLQKKFMRPY